MTIKKRLILQEIFPEEMLKYPEKYRGKDVYALDFSRAGRHSLVGRLGYSNEKLCLFCGSIKAIENFSDNYKFFVEENNIFVVS